MRLSGVFIQRNARNVNNVRNVTDGTDAMTSLLDRHTAGGSGQSQPPATTAYAAGSLPSCGRHATKYEIKFDLHH